MNKIIYLIAFCIHFDDNILCFLIAASAGVLDGHLSLQTEYYFMSAKERLATNLQRVCEDKSETQIEVTKKL